ncbi:MAG: hypothetical protein KDD37_08110, partial [Bdellovibrionales bacterium]|nr:hypothetical protein [Bdellovibrionales bacterium]
HVSMSALDRIVASLPRWVLVGGILVLGILFLLVFDPPHSVCDSQLSLLKSIQTPFLYLDSKKKYIKTTGFEASYTKCRNGNSLGACQNLFNGVLKLINDVEASNPECIADLGQVKVIKKAFRDTQDLMVELAWGNKPPESTYDKFGWLDNNHMFLFCRLTGMRIKSEGKNTWEKWREKTMLSLPNPGKLTRADIWRRSLFSASCSNY